MDIVALITLLKTFKTQQLGFERVQINGLLHTLSLNKWIT
jgi:hypothetical protein